MVKVAPDTEIETISERPLSAGGEKRKTRDDSVAALHEFFKELFRYLFTLFCFTVVIFLDSNWSQKHNSAQLFVQNIFNPSNAPTDVNSFWNVLYNAPSADGSTPCSGVFCTLGKLDYFSQELLAGQNGTQDAFLYFGNRLLGQVCVWRHWHNQLCFQLTPDSGSYAASASTIQGLLQVLEPV